MEWIDEWINQRVNEWVVEWAPERAIESVTKRNPRTEIQGFIGCIYLFLFSQGDRPHPDIHPNYHPW